MEQELAYSFHLGSDKNKSKLAKKVAKENLSGTTSLSNNAIQNAKDLSDVNKHNLRYFDNQTELIRTIYGTSDIVNDVKQVYWDEFEQARIEYNNKQTREDRKIEDYFKKVCDSQNDIACEIIIELGDMDFWNDKDERYRFKMVDVYNRDFFLELPVLFIYFIIYEVAFSIFICISFALLSNNLLNAVTILSILDFETNNKT